MHPSPPPGRPTPNVGIAREVVAIARFLLSKLEVVTRDGHHTLIVFIFFKQFIAKLKKSGVGDTVVFDENGPLFVFEYPVDASAKPVFKSQVIFGVIFVNFAWPVDKI